MANWAKVKLADCVNLLAGFPFKSQDFTDKSDDVALVKGENVSQGCILWDISKRWPASDWEKLEKFHLVPGDVVVAMDRPWIPAGLKWAAIRKGDPKALLVQRCARLRSSQGRLDQDFLQFVIGGQGFENYVKPITTGVNVPHISGQQILDFEFTLPPVPVQRRIAGILSAPRAWWRRFWLGLRTFVGILFRVLREILHLIRHSPATLRLRSRLSPAELYDTLMQRCDEAGFAQERRRLVAGLSGAVVELGCGTGLMFSQYADSVSLLAIDLDQEFLVRAHERARNAAAQIAVRHGSAEAIPVPDQSQDAVVVSLVLCSVDNIDKVLGEVRRVLKPEGKLVLIEHVRSSGAVAGPLMNLLDPIWLYLNRQGCHMNRQPIEKLQQSGFVIHEVVPFQIFAAGMPAFPMRRIWATVPRG